MDPSPYREGKPLAELIPPDRRRAKTLVLVACSMAAGAALFAIGSVVLAAWKDAVASSSPPPIAPPMLRGVSLQGPDGTVTLPAGEVTIVHVWLQGCSDCMPAFEAMRALQASGGFGVDAPEVNVSYGQASAEWAASYGVRSHLVYDVGGARVVKPLGISSFTTLVLDREGDVIHSDRPDREGYRERVREVVRTLLRTGRKRALPVTLSRESIEAISRSHAPSIRRECWNPMTDKSKLVQLAASFTVDRRGKPENVKVNGSDPGMAECVARNIRSWTFEETQQPTEVSIPFVFRRD